MSQFPGGREVSSDLMADLLPISAGKASIRIGIILYVWHWTLPSFKPTSVFPNHTINTTNDERRLSTHFTSRSVPRAIQTNHRHQMSRDGVTPFETQACIIYGTWPGINWLSIQALTKMSFNQPIRAHGNHAMVSRSCMVSLEELN